MLYNFPVIFKDSQCPFGCSGGDELLFAAKDRLHDKPGEFQVVRCKTCGLMRTDPCPTPETIGLYYPENYGPYLGTRVQMRRQKKTSWFRSYCERAIRSLIDFNTEKIPALSPGRLMEIGCASGAFMHQMSGLGWAVEGVEFSSNAAESVKELGFKVYAGSLETAPDPELQFDLIVGWMVLEHFHNPITSLARLLDWAKPGAWLVLSVPNAGSLEFHLFKEKWYALQVPTHLYHFTPQTIQQVLAIAGWKVQNIYHQRTLSNLIASVGYVLKDIGYERFGNKLVSLPDNAGRWPFILYPLAWLLSVFGQTGRMTVWARKI